MIAWWLYIIAYAYLLTTYPVSGMVLKSTLFLGIYLALRALFGIKRVPGDVLATLIVLWALAEEMITTLTLPSPVSPVPTKSSR